MTYAIFRKHFDTGDVWSLVGEADNLVAAVDRRESELRVQGGTVDIFSRLDILDAYAQAAREGVSIVSVSRLCPGAFVPIEPGESLSAAFARAERKAAVEGPRTGDLELTDDEKALIAKPAIVSDAPRPSARSGRSIEAREVTNDEAPF